MSAGWEKIAPHRHALGLNFERNKFSIWVELNLWRWSVWVDKPRYPRSH